MSESKALDEAREVLEDDRKKLDELSKKLEETEQRLSEEERLQDTIAAPTDNTKAPHYPGLG